MSKNHFFLRKVHSLLGLFPVGYFLVQHLVLNSLANRGPEVLNAVIAFMRSIPFFIPVEILIIFVPILFHAVLGVIICLDARFNVGNYGYFRNWLFLLQRITAIVTFAFIVFHVWEFRLSEVFYGREVSFDTVAADFSNPWIFGFFAVGILASTFHLANGISTALVTWGITVGPRAQRVATVLSGLFFLVVAAVGISAMFAFRIKL